MTCLTCVGAWTIILTLESVTPESHTHWNVPTSLGRPFLYLTPPGEPYPSHPLSTTVLHPIHLRWCFRLTYVFHRLVFFFRWEFSFSSPPLSPAPPPFQPPPAPPPPHTLESLLAASPPQLGRLHPKDQKDLKINLFTESEQKPPREGETTQRGPSHLSWGSPPGSDLPVDWEGRSTPTI